jgi:hypothetical protein
MYIKNHLMRWKICFRHDLPELLTTPTTTHSYISFRNRNQVPLQKAVERQNSSIHSTNFCPVYIFCPTPQVHALYTEAYPHMEQGSF